MRNNFGFKGNTRRLAYAMLMAGVFASGAMHPTAMAQHMPESFASVIEPLTPAVVNISSTRKVKGGNIGPEFFFPELPPDSPFNEFKDFFDRFNRMQRGGGDMPERKMFSLGSGFVIDPEGYIVTNNHVIADADEVVVKFPDNKQYTAKVIGKDKSTDLALLKIEAGGKLPYVKFGDSDKMKVGDWILAIGNPFGLGGTVTAGIISARGRDIYAGPFDDFLQIDAAINRGNSGGPLFNTQGEVIGINTAIFSPNGANIGIGFAVPQALAQPVIEQLKQYGKAKRGWLGVKIQTVTPEIAESLGMQESMGAMVVSVAEGSPANKAGILPGDVILKFNGKPVSDMRRLPRIVAETDSGKKVEVQVMRGSQTKTLHLVTGSLKEDEEKADLKEGSGKQDKDFAHKTSKAMGLTISSINNAIRRELNLDEVISGVIVLDIAAESAALERGLQPYDIITRVGDEDVKTAEDFVRRVAEAKKSGRKNVLIRLLRKNETAFITLPVE